MENVEIGKRKNFRKKSADTHSGRGTPFDPQSIMIYGPKDFGIQDSTTGERKTTIQPLDPNVEIRYLAQTTKDVSQITIVVTIRGAAYKTDLSLVDKIELARTYQNLTGKQI